MRVGASDTPVWKGHLVEWRYTHGGLRRGCGLSCGAQASPGPGLRGQGAVAGVLVPVCPLIMRAAVEAAPEAPTLTRAGSSAERRGPEPLDTP